MPRRALRCLSILALLAPAALARPLALGDLHSMLTVADPQISPDGAWIAYTVTRSDRERDEDDSDIWMVSWDGQQSVQLTRDRASEYYPRWSPDGRALAFLKDADDSKSGTRLWLLDRRGGEARPLTKGDVEIASFDWSPDGARIVFAGEAKAKSAADARPQPIVVDRFQFKEDETGYLGTARAHLYIVDARTEAITQLTDGMFNESLPVWSPDGTQIVFVTKRGDDPDLHDNWDIYAMEPKAAAPARQVTTNPGNDGDPTESWGVSRARFSPDGRRIAYLHGGAPELIWYGLVQIGLIAAAGGDAELPTRGLDRNTLDPQWSRDGKWLYFRLEDDRSLQLARVRLKDGRVERLTESGGVISGFDVGRGDRIVVITTTPERPAELAALESGKLRPLTRLNESWLREIELAATQPIEFASADGLQIRGLMVVPRGPRPPSGYPTLLDLHGGPVAQHQYEFDFAWQVFAAQGYAVIAPNPRGSSGQGERFQRLLWGEWGHVDLPDVLGAVDHAARAGVADAKRLGVGGWSYGAILTNYVIASDSRFRAAISGAGMSNMLAGYGIDHYVRDWEAEIGLPWQNTEQWLRLSYPFLHADRIKTPTLFMCGEQDFNVPLAASEQMYQALRRLGVPTQLIIYPDEHHGLSRPSFREDRLRRSLDWYDRHLAPQ
jgi:dipeptidyl aminopeptidase/acylaminoacyl peptidase